MAAPPRLSLLSPLRLWAVSNALFIAIVASSWYSSYRLAASDDQKLATVQAQTLTKARFDDLQNRRFRDFVEGIGTEFGDLYVRAAIGTERYEFGQESRFAHCGRVSYLLPGAGTAGRVDVTVCRPFVFSVWPILTVLGAYFAISTLSLFYIRGLDIRATSTLAGFLRMSGVEVDDSRGLIGIIAEIRGVREQLDRARERERELAGAQARAELAEQVAHDIRSPLAVLAHALDGSAADDAEAAPLLRGAVSRIRDIAEDLLSRHRARAERSESVVDESPPPPVELMPLLKTTIAEKRAEFRGSSRVRFDLAGPPDGEAVFARVRPSDFQRVVSNLINNAVEAIEGKPGRAAVALAAADGCAVVRVEDDGRGIPADTLARLGERGVTRGKTVGCGLGLYHARGVVESWGGRLEFDSTPGKGTTVTVRLPCDLVRSEQTVLIDDDPLTRKNWQMAAKALGKAFKAYARAPDMLGEIGSLSKETAIYIDSRLGAGIRGADVALDLARRGYSNLYLTTGEDAENWSGLPQLRAVVGKEPPWTS